LSSGGRSRRALSAAAAADGVRAASSSPLLDSSGVEGVRAVHVDSGRVDVALRGLAFAGVVVVEVWREERERVVVRVARASCMDEIGRRLRYDE
jgi:hypothetical protein